MARLYNDDDLIIEETPEPQAAPEPPRGPSADDARVMLREKLEEIMQAVLAELGLKDAALSEDAKVVRLMLADIGQQIADNPSKLCFTIRITTGTGKSELLRQAIAKFIIEAKRRGLLHRVLILVPTHKLADEAERRMPAGISTMVWQGRDAVKLGGSNGEKMCRNPDAVKAALAIGAVVEETACRKTRSTVIETRKPGSATVTRTRHKLPTVYCPHYLECAYQRQKQLAHDADVVFAAHEILFQVPAAMGEFALVVIDEGFWQKGLTGLAPKSRLLVEGLARELDDAPVQGYHNSVDVTGTETLKGLTLDLMAALDQMPDGFVQRAPLVDYGFVPEDADTVNTGRVARELEWKRKIDPKLKPDSSDDFRAKVVKKCGFMRRLPRRAQMWKAVENLIAGSDQQTGRLRLETVETDEGKQRFLRVMGRREIASKLASSPMIYLDATAPVELTRNYRPELTLALDLNVEAPHMKVFQVVGMPVGKTSLEAKAPGVRKGKQKGAWTETPEQVEARVTRKRARLVTAVKHLTRGKRGLVITYEAIEDDFAGIDNVETAHFGNFTGIDAWKDVQVLVVIGRPLPSPSDIENLASATTGRPILAGEMLEQNCRVTNSRGAGRILKRKFYDTPEAEQVRQAVTNAAVEQALGRLRGVNRGPDNPCEAFLIVGDTVIENQVLDDVIDISMIEPDAIDLMLARGWEPQLATDAAKLFPDLFPSRKAAQKAYERDRLRAGAGRFGPRLENWPHIKDISRATLQPPRGALLFQPCGPGQLRRFCIVDLEKVPDPRAVLEAAWGPLALFQMVEPVRDAAE